MKLRIATYNIHKGVSSLTRRVRIQDVRLGLVGLDADIVFLQEVQDVNHTQARFSRHHPGIGQVDFLADVEYPHRIYGMNASYRTGHHGNAILSRQPILRWENLDISDHRFEQRGLLHAVAQLPIPPGQTGQAVSTPREIHLLCVHLGLFDRSRTRQITALIQRVRDTIPDDAPLLIAGDFNDWRNRLHAPLMKELGVTEAFAHGCPQAAPARTFPSRMPWLRLDRIYVRGCHVHHARVAYGPGWGGRSDHAPLVAEIELDKT